MYDPIDMNLNKLWEIVKDREAWHVAVPSVTKNQTQLRDRTTIKLGKGVAKPRVSACENRK